MKEGFGAVKNIPSDLLFPRYIPREIQLQRLRRAVRQELSPRQRETVEAYYFENKTLVQIAEERSVNKSTVCRTLKRAENKLRRFLQY